MVLGRVRVHVVVITFADLVMETVAVNGYIKVFILKSTIHKVHTHTHSQIIIYTCIWHEGGEGRRRKGRGGGERREGRRREGRKREGRGGGERGGEEERGGGERRREGRGGGERGGEGRRRKGRG